MRTPDFKNQPFKEMYFSNELKIDLPTIKQRKRIEFEIDKKFWAILPSLNLNFHTKEIEFEWICIGIYWRYTKYI